MTSTDTAETRIEVRSDTNPLWRDSEAGGLVTVQSAPLIDAGANVLTLGSCFAQNIREALDIGGFHAHPRYGDLDVDHHRQMAGPLRHINYYTTFSIRQEFERMLDGLGPEQIHVPIRDGAWMVNPSAMGIAEGVEPWQANFQDSLRHGVVGVDEEATLDVMSKVDDMTRTAIENADAYVITLGLIESWIDTETGRHVWSAKVNNVAPDPSRYVFHRSDYQENYEQLAWLCDTIGATFPGRPIIITVSPVGLLRTFTDDDVVVANMYSKSVLRAVAGAIEQRYDHVTYWPSYEYVLASDVYKEDGRHVERSAVDHIVAQFMKAHTVPTETDANGVEP